MMYPWGDERRYNSYSGYFRRIFGSRVQKLSVNVGFTCPNRDGTVGLPLHIAAQPRAFSSNCRKVLNFIVIAIGQLSDI